MRRTVLAALLLAAWAAPCPAEDGGDGRSFGVDGVTSLSWEDLAPEGDAERQDGMYMTLMQKAMSIGEGGAMDVMTQIDDFAVVDLLDGQKVRLPGYIVPFDFDSQDHLSEFLLVPYFGACIHVPPPPPNQVVYVTARSPVKVDRHWDAVLVEGVLRTRRHEAEIADAAYTLELTRIAPFE